MKPVGQKRYAYLRLRVYLKQMSHMGHLWSYHRDKHVTEQTKSQCSLEKSDKDSRHTPLEPEKLAVELHKRLKYVSDKGCHTKWQKHTAQTVYQPYRGTYHYSSDYQPHYAVECIWSARTHVYIFPFITPAVFCKIMLRN